MSRSRRSRTFAVLAGLALAALVPTGATPAPAGAVGGFCGYQSETGLDVFRWDGGGDGVRWADAQNWVGNQEPDLTYADTGYVCLESGLTVEIDAGTEARLQAIDVEGGARLEVTEGGKLFVYGDQSTRPSSFRAGSTVLLEAGTIGGPGRVDVAGLMVWRALPPTMTTGRAATLTTDPCDVDEPPLNPCSPTGTGRLVVGDTGRLRVDGRGVNLFSRYRIIVRGEMVLSGESYVAADRTAAIELRARANGTGVGILDLRNDGGIYEGFARGEDTLADVVNGGLIRKSGGTGTSAITGDYTVVGNGGVEVRTGTLALPTGSVEAAQVAGGASFGTGRCANSGEQCTPTTDPEDPTLYRAFVPTTDRDGALVSVREGMGTKGERLDRPVQILARGLTSSSVLRLTLRYDADIVGSRTTWTIRIYRIPVGSSTEIPVSNCRADGSFPSAGSVACVWRQRSSSSGGDLVMTVRNRSQFKSRWVGR